MVKAKMIDIQVYLPSYSVKNDELIEQMNLTWTSEEIYKKTGIRQRHIALEEDAADLAVEATNRLFAEHDGLREKIDYIIFCTQSPLVVLPATACILHERLGLKASCGAIDINHGCSGYVYGLSLAKALIESKVATNVILITAETYSKYLDYNDKATRTIFGDGAAATYITGDSSETVFIDDFIFGTDGAGAENLIVRDKQKKLYMDGPEIFQFTLQIIPKLVNDILKKKRLVLEDIDYFIFHQANAYILSYLRDKIGIEKNKFCIDMEDTGNTVSVSIPLALKRAILAGKVVPGMRIMLIGFGVGYSWGGCLLEL